jgi:hypothetical protein
MTLLLILRLSQMLNQGVQISAHDMRIDVVRTDHEPASEHHPVLDMPDLARLKPFTVTIRTKGGEAIHAIVVNFSIVDANGVSHDLPQIHDGASSVVVFPNNATAFWPGGRVVKAPPPDMPNAKPLIFKTPDELLAMIEQAKSVTFSVPFIEYADGTVYDEGGWAARMAQSRQRRAQRGIK